MANKKLYWNDGHSKTDPGAVGYVVERKVAVKVGNYAIAHLKANYEVSIKRSTGDVGSLTYICNEANKWGADLFVSVHFNAGGGDGYEALVYNKDNYQLGRVFEKHVLAVGQNSRGVKYRPDLGVLRLTDMKAILNEIAFVDNKKDIKDWDEDDELKKMGIALAEATAKYMKLPKKKTSTKPSNTSTNASTNASNASTEYEVLITSDSLNVRQKADIKSKVVGKVKKGQAFTITKEVTNGGIKWGRLKSGAGYISLNSKYSKKV